ncbi:PLD nuclease N-terminal domain-containing protein [Cytobacillus sp. FJAT-53684]|uniref:PLD nuclease N-terminal domain-containing protein n=1 Tax=Cytobacillus mangrovibacter TaxID=3299024 RepID=A0ABW6JVE5_9BACI
MSEINWAVIVPIIAPIILIQLILMLIAIIDLVRNDKTNGPKWLWILLILFVNIIGPILYFVVGRRNN